MVVVVMEVMVVVVVGSIILGCFLIWEAGGW